MGRQGQPPAGERDDRSDVASPAGRGEGEGAVPVRATRPAAIAVILPTRDRGDSIVVTLESLLANRWRDFEVVIVDQSADARTEASLQALPPDARVRHLRSSLRGLSHALNAGIEASSADLIAITGDDCEVAEDWLEAIVNCFASQERRLGVVFGSVLPAAHDRQAGFVQASGCERPFLARTVRDKSRLGGTSACMALRREVFHRLHGFDGALGVGAPLRAAEDADFAIRALQAGFWVLEEPRIEVTHRSFMAWHRLAEIVERNWFGTGAAVGKLFKSDPVQGVRVLGGLGGRWLSPRGGVAATLGNGAYRGLRLAAFARGLVAGLARPVDTATGHFRAAPRSPK